MLRTTKRFAFLGLMLTALALGASATAAPAAPRDADARFEALLKAIDVLPTRAQLDAGFPDARARLLAAAAQDGRDAWTRSRAIGFLGLYPEAPVRAALEGLSAHADPEVRRQAVYTLARAFGDPGDPALVARVLGLTDDTRPAVRDHAIRALRWVRHAAADQALERLSREHADPAARALAASTRQRRAAVPSTSPRPSPGRSH